jgi:hypothetical protein
VSSSITQPSGKAAAVEKKIEATQSGIVETIEGFVSDHTFGNPENPLRWTTKSLRNIAKQLNKQGFKVSHRTVLRLLKGLGYSLQVNKKYLQKGEPHPDSFEQIAFIDTKSIEFMSKHEPVISVDTKKKENIGNFKNNGVEYWTVKTSGL